jgi:hypothetical protein
MRLPTLKAFRLILTSELSWLLGFLYLSVPELFKEQIDSIRWLFDGFFAFIPCLFFIFPFLTAKSLLLYPSPSFKTQTILLELQSNVHTLFVDL